MATKIYSSGNYVIVDYDGKIYEYAKGHTLYTFIDDIFYIKEITEGQFKVTVADITAGNIVNASNVPYSLNTFTTFLRDNTGFKTAPGGSGATPVGATLMKTGQTTSYRTGDDGDIEAGRATSFTVLASNNPFGNTNRFTDELGGTSYANNWVIDWSTYNGSNVLGYFRTPQTAAQWNNAVTNSLGTFGTFSGCRLTNIRELMNIINFQNGNGTFLFLLQYAPFNIVDDLWSSTTLNTQSNFAWYMRGNSQPNLVLYEGKGGSFKYIPCRTFTVTGTTLT